MGKTMDDLVNVTEAAKLAGVSRQGLYDLIAKRTVTPLLIAGRRVFRVSEMRSLRKARAKLARSTMSKEATIG